MAKLDYLNVGNITRWKSEETVVLSTKIFKINKRNKKQERIFLLTGNSIYNIKPNKKSTVIQIDNNNDIICQRRIALNKISSITISCLSSQFTINIPSEYDYQYEAFDMIHQKEIINAIYFTCKKEHGVLLTIHKINKMSTAQFTVKKSDDNSIVLLKRQSTKQQQTIRLSCSTTKLCENVIPKRLSNDNDVKCSNISSAPFMEIDMVKAPTYADYVQIGTGKLQIKEYTMDTCPNIIKYDNTSCKINNIQKETKAMEASKYYSLLIDGYIRNIEDSLQFSLIPDDIKALCVVFYYKFLTYNEYCNVEFKKEFDSPKLLIQNELKVGTITTIPWGCRLVSRLPINRMDSNVNGKISIKIIDTFDVVGEDEFKCIAINDYYASVTDELDLRFAKKYTIMQTDSSGWWYAVDEDGEDGWVPSNYLKRIDDNNHGDIGIGITANPKSFMNIPITQHPFKGKDVQHAICQSSREMLVITDGGIKKNEVFNGIKKGLLLHLWIENNKLKIYNYKDNGKSSAKMCQQDLLRGNDGNILDYYFAMAFTATSLNDVKYEISGEFI